ncbi:hypothetical protein [Ruminococcus flavefaciens]|uniref:hypothetical protein n=1 Tax=Ruminococcus flavefaciens TaxID=1265 RepID=UPI0013DB301F|nr:hypothetical protein [Ruminococcus flavefaciens]
MEEKNIFDILENTEQSVIDRLSEEFPPDDAEEKEKVFRMSQEKFNKANNTSKFTEADEQTVSGVEVVCKRPLWKKCLSMAAAAAILIGGAAGGFKAYKHFANTPTISDKENITEEPTTEQTTTEQPTTEPLNNNCPFDFAAHEFIRPDPDSKTAIFVNFGKSEEEGGDGITGFSLRGGNVIPLEKRQELADFFNSLEWEEADDEPKVLPEFLYTYERFCFYSLSDDNFIILNFDGDQSTVTLTSCKVMLESDYTDENHDPSDKNAMNRVIQYSAVDETIDINDVTKVYKIDYDLIKSKMNEIFGEDFIRSYNEEKSILNREWEIEHPFEYYPITLNKEDNDFIYNILRKCKWEKLDDTSSFIEENMQNSISIIDLSCYEDNIRYSFIIMSSSDITFIGYGEWQPNDDGIEEPVYTSSWINKDNINAVQQITDYINSKHSELTKEVPVDLSVIDRVDWLYSALDTKQFDITDDKMQKLKECLGRYDWEMTDDSNYFGYDIGIIGTTDNNNDSITELRIGKAWDGKATIRFGIYESAEIDGKLMAMRIKETKSEFDCGNRSYICDDENAYSEIEKILSE